jgi:hypothetical protein
MGPSQSSGGGGGGNELLYTLTKEKARNTIKSECEREEEGGKEIVQVKYAKWL